jgi:hypothetical protein
MSKRADQNLIDEVVSAIRHGHHKKAKAIILTLPKKEAVVATAYAVNQLRDHRDQVNETAFLDQLLY